MKHKTFIPVLLVLSFSLGCEHESPVTPPPPEVDDQIEQAVLQELQQIESGVQNQLAKHGDFVVLPAGSVDGLADALEEAGRNGIVLVKSGLHKESATVFVTKATTIIGEPGAILEVDTEPWPTTSVVEPALHIKNARSALIWGLEIRPKGSVGGAAILVDHTPNAIIGHNTLVGHQFGVLVEQSDHTRIIQNTIATTLLWQTGELIEVEGVVVINGEHTLIANNDISNAFLGLWACSRKGTTYGNKYHDNFIGLILCKVPDAYFPLADGRLIGAEFSGTKWEVRRDFATHNVDAGFLVIDGANKNSLKNNNGSENGTYDIELTGDSYRFGSLTPKSFDNRVVAGLFQGVKIKDCGDNNTVIGGQLVDNAQDPCF
ncbi:MAG: right-handed parallel beta-helix repeat-containing protein [bacterium]